MTLQSSIFYLHYDCARQSPRANVVDHSTDRGAGAHATAAADPRGRYLVWGSRLGIAELLGPGLDDVHGVEVPLPARSFLIKSFGTSTPPLNGLGISYFFCTFW